MGSRDTPHTETPALPVLVEGSTDGAFLTELNYQTTEIDVNIRDCGGKDGVLESIVTLAGVQIKRFCAFIDIDESDPDRILQQVQDKLEGNFDHVERLSSSVFHVNEYSQVHVGCIGLHNDEILREYGVTRHAMEDHALNLLLTDNDIVPRLSGTSIETLEQFKEALSEQKSSIESHMSEIDKSKMLLRISMLLLGFDNDTETFVKGILRCTDSNLESHSSTGGIVEVIDI